MFLPFLSLVNNILSIAAFGSNRGEPKPVRGGMQVQEASSACASGGAGRVQEAVLCIWRWRR